MSPPKSTTSPDQPAPDYDAFKSWTPAAQERALAELRARTNRTWRAFWCPQPGCTGTPHPGWEWNHARTDQHPPSDPEWFVWLLLSGRGTGKTRVGSEFTNRMTKVVPRVAIIGGTAPDVRDIMVEGESGLLTIAKPDHRPHYEPSKRRLTWPNGAVGTTFSAEEPDRLRGPEHYYAWWDEPAHAPLVQAAWDNLLLGMRLGRRPVIVATTTPKPRPWLKELVADTRTRIARASTYDNLDNLSPVFAETVISRFEGTRLGRQELYGEILTDVEGALWTWDIIEPDRLPANAVHQCTRIVVAVDPAGTAKRTSDETGIVVVGISGDHLYVLADRSGRMTPFGWANAVQGAYDEFSADAIVTETNYGGDMVTANLRNAGTDTKVIGVHSRRGKQIRAEPIAAIYEQHRAHHVGLFTELEEELCLVGDTLIETARGHVRIDEVHAGDLVLTRAGWAPVAWAGMTSGRTTLTTVTHDVGSVVSTRWHRFWTTNRGYVAAHDVGPSDLLLVRPSTAATAYRSPGADAGTGGCPPGTTATPRANFSTAPSGVPTTATSRLGTSSTTATASSGTTVCATWNFSPTPTIDACTAPGPALASSPSLLSRTLSGADVPGITVSRAHSSVTAAARRSPRTALVPDGAHGDVDVWPEGIEPVYDIKVVDGFLPEFFANGVLVHNTGWVPTQPGDSPNRLDALVHGATALLGRRAASSIASPHQLTATPRRHLGPQAGRPERWPTP